jgi:hypothetical protein
MSGDMQNKIGIIEIVTAVLISLTASWIYVKEDLAQLNVRADQTEEQVSQVREDMKEYAEINRELSKTLNNLNVVLSGMKVQMGYIEEGVNELKQKQKEESK